MCEQLAQSCYSAAERPGVEPTASLSRVPRPNHNITKRHQWMMDFHTGGHGDGRTVRARLGLDGARDDNSSSSSSLPAPNHSLPPRSSVTAACLDRRQADLPFHASVVLASPRCRRLAQHNTTFVCQNSKQNTIRQ